MLFGERLRTHRQRRGITQDELALLTGVSARTIRNLESGRIGTARPSTARLLADALALHGAEHDHFLGEDETPRVPDAEQWGAWPTPAQLPADVAGFTGRTGHLRQLTGLLDADAMPAAVVITAISGTAGIGKPNPGMWHIFSGLAAAPGTATYCPNVPISANHKWRGATWNQFTDQDRPGNLAGGEEAA